MFDQQMAQPAGKYAGERHGDQRQPTPIHDGHHDERSHREFREQMQRTIRRMPMLRQIADVECVE